MTGERKPLWPKRLRRLRDMEPIYPVPPLVPASTCPHGIDIRRGDYCEVCSRTAWPDELVLQSHRSPRTDPRPESKRYVPGKLKGGRS